MDRKLIGSKCYCGDPFCSGCDQEGVVTSAELRERAENVKRMRRNLAARARRQAYADCGMVRVRGSLGGVYYE